jgi:membrane protein DedA with SNARE-associated domain
MPPILAYALAQGAYYKYILILFGTAIGGPGLVLASGFMLRLGLLELLPLILALGAGELALDTIWYFVGKSHGERLIRNYGKFFGLSEGSFDKIQALYERYHMRILFFAKSLTGFGLMIPIIIVAGATNVPFRRFFAVCALGEAVALFFLIATGYFFGELYTRVVEGLRIVFLIVTILASGAAIFGATRYAKKRILGRTEE